ncbi:DNA damage-binding protein 1-like [Vicia villosa]|uniref:DNA damage-binding protein 1-like n=1 Tax=Vicia villosa TaxID=3911 RepID=UPI00273C6575|nr:DNA damage-binding protein 1-like [Vicia villosa]
MAELQLIKVTKTHDDSGSCVEIMENYMNWGPISDLCVVDPKKKGQHQVVTCSGAYKAGSLGVFCYRVGFNELAFGELEGIKRMWSLGCANDLFDSLLVISFISKTRVFVILENDLNETEIQGLWCQHYFAMTQFTINLYR